VEKLLSPGFLREIFILFFLEISVFGPVNKALMYVQIYSQIPLAVI